MEGKTTNRELTNEQLRDAGASEAYIAYYRAAMELDWTTASTNHAEKVVREGVSYSGGGFHDALWNDEPRWSGDNPFGADESNAHLLRQAGVY